MIRRVLGALVVLTLLAAGACTSTKGRISSGDRTTISREELAERPTSNVFEVVRAIRPTWLRALPGALGRSATTGPLIYVDGRPAGEVDILYSMSTRAVERIQHLSAAEAQNKYSMSQARPVIDIVSRASSG